MLLGRSTRDDSPNATGSDGAHPLHLRPRPKRPICSGAQSRVLPGAVVHRPCVDKRLMRAQFSRASIRGLVLSTEGQDPG